MTSTAIINARASAPSVMRSSSVRGSSLTRTIHRMPAAYRTVAVRAQSPTDEKVRLSALRHVQLVYGCTCFLTRRCFVRLTIEVFVASLGLFGRLVREFCLHIAMVLHSRHDVYGARQFYLNACSSVKQLENAPKHRELYATFVQERSFGGACSLYVVFGVASIYKLRLTRSVSMQMQNQGDQKMVEPNGAGPSKGIENIEAGNISNENAERRANAGPDQSFTSIQAFDGVGEYYGLCTHLCIIVSRCRHYKFLYYFVIAPFMCIEVSPPVQHLRPSTAGWP